MGAVLRVLYVDDDELSLRAARRSIRGDLGIHLITLTSAVEAIATLGRTRPDLIIMDVFMPDLDGVEGCRRIKASAQGRNIEVILTSVEMDDDLELVGQLAGASRGISKPIDLKKIITPPQHPPPPVDAPGVNAKPTTAIATQPSPRGADLLVQMLAQAGVDVVFGLPGGAISPVHDALIDHSIRVITTKHEAGAMFAAAGYAHATGKLGVVAVTSGPGALNAMTGLASAWCDGLPLLLLVGDVPRGAQGRGVLQDSSAHGLQIVEMSRHITKLAAEISSSTSMPHMVRRAIATALSGRKGPVVLTLPIDVMMQPCSAPRFAGSITMGGHVAGETLDEITELLLGAERPLILAGSGVRGNGAPARLRQTAERFNIPVATTPKGKGVFPESHELSLGVLGLGGHKSARAYIDAGADVVLAIGTSLGDVATDGFAPALQASRALIHVDIDARQVGKSYAPTHAVVASAVELLGGLADRRATFKPLKRFATGSTPPPFKNTPANSERPFAGTAACAEGAATSYLAPSPEPAPVRPTAGGVVRHVLASSSKPDRIASHDAIREIQRCLPKDTIYTIDSGEHFLFSVQYLEIDHADSFVVMTGLGSMGQSIGAAIGAQLAHPNRTVAAICGDGCFAMNAFEIATAVQEQIPLRVFVFNDEALGMVENGHEMVYGRRPRYSTGPLDILSIARGLGATTARVGQLGQLDPEIFNTPGPVVIDVRIDADVKIPKVDRVAVMSTKAPKKATPMVEPPPAERPPLRVVN